ncbi:MAG: alpha/beta hydrolase [Actinobacteria bacterium]|jgi:pimeloyl-ACP methyl ester carboxylesterase|nr:MAG: alpha/beta hydrolase [Actinomycetota bacterium]
MKKAPMFLVVFILATVSAGITACGRGDNEPARQNAQAYVDAVETQEVAVGDISMAYKAFGSGDPLLMIMGFSGTMDLWEPRLIADLAGAGYEVLIFDNRGMGETSAGTRPFTIEQFADDTAGLMDALGMERAHVLAWSMGTNIAQEMALRHADKVDGLVLYAADCGGDEAIMPSDEVMSALTDTSGTAEERGQRLIGLLFPSQWMAQNPDFMQRFPQPSESSSPDSVARQAQAMGAWGGSYGRLPQVASPTLVVTGTQDILTPPENSMIIVERIPRAWLAQFEGAGHGLMYQYPERFTGAILAFLADSAAR